MHGRDVNFYFRTMMGAVFLLTLLPAWVACSGEGNIRLLEDEVTVALKACSYPDDTAIAKESTIKERQRRSDDSYDGSPRIDDNMKQGNRYSHEKRNTNDSRDQILVLNTTDYDYKGYETGKMGETLLISVPQPASAANDNVNMNNISRTRRSDPLLNKADSGQCLSQCVFANLQVVDSHGIPREAELWNKIQSSVTSQQSRSALHDQITACFQELKSEAEDNGCSYSNKLERCLMLRFSDRKTDAQTTTQKPPPTE